MGGKPGPQSLDHLLQRGTGLQTARHLPQHARQAATGKLLGQGPQAAGQRQAGLAGLQIRMDAYRSPQAVGR